MVSHFGEVIFPSSRAFWDDEDEYEPVEGSQQRSKLFVRWLKSKPEHAQKFIIVEGDPLIPFAQQCLCREAEEMCVIEDADNKKISAIYEIDKEIYLCIILPRFNTKDAGTLINEISDLLLNTESMISIVCRHVSQFQSTITPDDPSFLRILTTKSINEVSNCKIKLLEQPNIIFGIGAGVLSYAELIGKPAKLYALYIDSFVLDSKSAEPIREVLSNELHYELHHNTFAKSFFSKGNLYM